jgi:hypothetical protein
MIANALSDIVRCAIKQEMKLQKLLLILRHPYNFGSQDPNYNILTFHSTLNGANDNTDVVVPNSSNRVLSSEVLCGFDFKTNPECYITTSFQLIVTPVPQVEKMYLYAHPIRCPY